MARNRLYVVLMKIVRNHAKMAVTTAQPKLLRGSPVKSRYRFSNVTHLVREIVAVAQLIEYRI